MSLDEFGDLTIAQFEALLDRRREEDRRGFIHAGVIAAAIYNTAPFSDPERKAVSPMDFVPDYQNHKQKLQYQRQSLDEQIAVLTNIFGCGPSIPS